MLGHTCKLQTEGAGEVEELQSVTASHARTWTAERSQHAEPAAHAVFPVSWQPRRNRGRTQSEQYSRTNNRLHNMMQCNAMLNTR